MSTLLILFLCITFSIFIFGLQSILKRPLNLLAMTVGLKQKEIVDKIVEKVIIYSLIQFGFDLILTISADSYC